MLCAFLFLVLPTYFHCFYTRGMAPIYHRWQVSESFIVTDLEIAFASPSLFLKRIHCQVWVACRDIQDPQWAFQRALSYEPAAYFYGKNCCRMSTNFFNHHINLYQVQLMRFVSVLADFEHCPLPQTWHLTPNQLCFWSKSAHWCLFCY